MSFLKELFADRNQKKWYQLLKAQEITDDFKNIINNFLLPDNIDIELYKVNNRAVEIYRMGASIDVVSFMNNEKIECSPTFKDHYEDHKYSIHKPKAFHDWFIIGYPDVSKWFSTIAEELVNSYLGRENEITEANGKANYFFYRLIINKYKINHSLECKFKS